MWSKLILCLVVLFVALSIFSNNTKVYRIQKLQTESNDYAKVKYIVDGDTIDVLINGKFESVRLLGINAPETVDQRKPVECFGIEASEKLKELLGNKEVLLKSDSTQADRDKYGRLLRYIYLYDGTLINKVMIEQGYAYEYTYDIPYKFQKEFKSAELLARFRKRGLWVSGICLK